MITNYVGFLPKNMNSETTSTNTNNPDFIANEKNALSLKNEYAILMQDIKKI